MKAEILSVEWRSGINTVGIVLVRTNIGKLKSYIGCSTFAQSVSLSAREIADFGAKLTFREAKAFFPHIKKSEYDGTRD